MFLCFRFYWEILKAMVSITHEVPNKLKEIHYRLVMPVSLSISYFHLLVMGFVCLFYCESTGINHSL